MIKVNHPSPVLITLTSPTAAGKSYLFNHIRDVAKLPCLVSTTTRPPRKGEIEGVDYYFISEEESKAREAADDFAELAIYRGVRYGVTKTEFANKLSSGMAFLIVEPGGIDHYVKPALEAGASWLKYYVHTDPELRMERFLERMKKDVAQAIQHDVICSRMDSEFDGPSAQTMKVISSYFDRQRAMLTEEMKWGTMHQWDRTLFGDKEPEFNLSIILRDIEQLRVKSRV